MHYLFKEGKSKREISQRLNIRKQTIVKWLATREYKDNRGWKKNKFRKEQNNSIVAERIGNLKQQRIDQKKYFLGSEYVKMDYVRNYPHDPIPSIWFIDEVVRKAGLQTRKPKGRKKRGGAKYLLYPVEAIKCLGYIQQSVDFIGKKYIAGRTEPINIFSSAYYAPFKLFQIKRIAAEKTSYAIESLKEQWQLFPLPNVLRIDNGLQFRGTASGKRAVGLFLRFLLNLNIIPLFSSPSKPWTNPHIEGHNRIFNEKIWNNNHFRDLEQIDNECERFNQESLDYFQFRYTGLLANQSNLRYLREKQLPITDQLVSTQGKKIYFIRFVETYEQKTSAYINILNEPIVIPEKYSYQFVFVEWNLEEELLSVYSEYEQNITLIQQIKFKINI